MRREARIVRLESSLEVIANEDLEPPRAAGRTRRQATAEYLAWLQRRLTRRRWPDDEQEQMQRQIIKLTEALARFPEGEQ